MTKKTKIICTIGPKSESYEKLEKMTNLGMNVCRLNFSHGDYEEHSARIKTIKEVRKNLNKNLAILLDTKGPEIRTHQMENGAVLLEQGSKVTVSMTEVLGTSEKFSITYEQLVYDVKKGDTILLDDGLIGLSVQDVDIKQGLIYTTVQNGGVLKNKKGVNVPGVSTKLPGITEKDEQDIRFGCKQGIDFVAASFVRTKENVLEVRRILKEEGCEHVQIIPKVECQECVDNIESVIEVSDGIMIARGDLGVEVPAEQVPIIQKNIINLCNKAGKFVITATQMLDSMQKNPRPTRAEVSDVANAIFDGTDAIMLSGESAAGKYPVESVETMAKIAKRTEDMQDYSTIITERSKIKETVNLTNAIGISVAHTALNLNLHTIVTYTESGQTARLISKYRPNASILAVTPSEKVARGLSLVWGVQARVSHQATSTDDMLETALNLNLHTIVTYTESGQTARLISKYRPNASILAVTPSEKVARGLSLVWGVQARVSHQATSTDDMLETANEIAKESGYAKEGDPIIITGGIPVNTAESNVGTTNFIKVSIVK